MRQTESFQDERALSHHWWDTRKPGVEISVTIHLEGEPVPENLDRGQKYSFLRTLAERKAAQITDYFRSNPEIFGSVELPLEVNAFLMIFVKLTPEQCTALTHDLLGPQGIRGKIIQNMIPDSMPSAS